MINLYPTIHPYGVKPRLTNDKAAIGRGIDTYFENTIATRPPVASWVFPQGQPIKDGYIKSENAKASISNYSLIPYGNTNLTNRGAKFEGNGYLSRPWKFRPSDTAGTVIFTVSGRGGTVFSAGYTGSDLEYLAVGLNSLGVQIQSSTVALPAWNSCWALKNMGQEEHTVILRTDGADWFSAIIDGESVVITISAGTNVGNWFGDLTNADNFSIGTLIRNAGPENYFNGIIHQIYFFDYNWSGGAIRKFRCSDPYGALQPTSPSVYFFQGAAGGGTAFIPQFMNHKFIPSFAGGPE